MIGKKHKQNQKGLSLYLTIIVSGIILFIVSAISGIAFRQLQFSGIGDQSQQAFYAANSGLECVLYWDLHHAPFATPLDYPQDFEGSDIECGNTDINTDEEELDIEVSENSVVSSFEISFDNIGCNAKVEIKKTQAPDGSIDTEVSSRGESGVCEGSDSVGQYQRGIEAKY